jgi:hypothetical protein
MKWQHVAYRAFILGSVALFSYMTLDILWFYFRLAQSPAESGSCCLDSAVVTVAIAVCGIAASTALFLIRKTTRE